MSWGTHRPLYVLLAVHEAYYILDNYRAILSDAPGFVAGAAAEDDFPF